MAVQVTPITPALPATTAIQDPAARRFAQAVQDALKAMQSSEAALEGLAKAASALLSAPPGGVPPSIADWLFASELYRKLTERIERVDLDTKRAFIDEALALAEEYDPERTYAKDEVVRLDGVFYRSLVDENLGNEPPNGDFWAPSGIFQTLGEAIAALVEVERTARVTEVDATTANIDAAVSRIGTAEAAITSEETTRATNDLAIVQALDTLWTISGASKALSQDGKNLITNWQTATAEEWSTLQAEVLDAGGNTLYAAVAAEAEARAEQTGELYAQYTVKVDANGYVAGFGVASEATVAGQNTSSFIVLADRLAVVKPNQDGTEVPYVPFAIDETGIYFNGKVQFSNVQNAPPADATRNVYQGGWVAGKAYLVGDIVLSEGNGWICIEAHTSSTANKPPASSGTTSTYWGIYTVKGEAGAPGAAGPAGATGATGPTGTTGDTGASSMKIFIRSTSPSTPANSSGVPSGWSSTVPSGTSPVWESTGNRSAGGSVYVWTTPMISAEHWRRPNETTIDGAKIYTGEAYVNTLQIKGNAVTVPLGGTFSVGGSFGPNTNPITAADLNPHFADTTKVVIVANVIVSLSGGSTNVRARVLRDGSAIGDFSTTTQGDSTQSHTFVFSDTAPAGSRAYSIQLGNDWWGGGAWTVVSLGLALIGMQR